MNIYHSIFFVSATAFISLLSTQVLAFKVDVVESIDPAKCVLVTKESCTSSKSDSLKACTEIHVEKAENLDADTIIITNSKTSKHRKPSLTGGMKTVTITEVSANYYTCKETSAPVVNATPRPSEKSIEERLNILKQLKDKTLISAEEYKKKKSEILQEL